MPRCESSKKVENLVGFPPYLHMYPVAAPWGAASRAGAPAGDVPPAERDVRHHAAVPSRCQSQGQTGPGPGGLTLEFSARPHLMVQQPTASHGQPGETCPELWRSGWEGVTPMSEATPWNSFARRGVLLSALLLLGLLAMSGTPARADGPLDFTLKNRLGVTITHVYVSPHHADTWEEDVLGKDVLRDGGHVKITFNAR